MKKDNIIDLTSRMAPQQEKRPLNRNLKLRLDLEQAKIAVSTSLISVVLLVTLANNALLAPKASEAQSVAVSTTIPSRGIASVSIGAPEEERALVKHVASLSLNETASIGRKPSRLDEFSFGYLEGKYHVEGENGKVAEVEFSNDPNTGNDPKEISDRAQFLRDHKDVLSVKYESAIRVSSSTLDEKIVESYQLLNSYNMPVARVDFKLSSNNGLLYMKVIAHKVAAK